MKPFMKFLGNAPVFVVAYVLFMVPTYFLPYVGSNSSILHGLDAVVGGGNLNPAFWSHLVSMLILCFLCWIRGAYVAKGWLVIFPVLAIVFDFMPGLSVIPLIPTVMHLFAIVLGVVGSKKVAAASTSP